MKAIMKGISIVVDSESWLWEKLEWEVHIAEQGFWSFRRQCRCGESGPGKWSTLSMDRIRTKKNPLLVIHDSRGFEAAGTSNLKEVKRFIQHFAGMSTLEKQLHCIWYYIDCSDSRF
ncbi:hypothetical protein BKA64DRAFT_179045 [Cadophora sp. MPI-SDFR-AT-0126]|nr:hypothetical protein BKA64DRAFT_179045 [Leotiomycetes sp. MPI-SDFR-AT-0126]